MAWPTTGILSVLTEMQLTTGEWKDITAYVYGDPENHQVTIQRGRTSEGFAVEPAQSSFWLKNSDGRFSPRNPQGAYYGLFSRNTPVRHCVRPGLTSGSLADLSDAFGRTVALGNNWGTADSGQSWTRTSATGASKLSVSSGSGRLLLSAAGDAPGAKVTGMTWTDIDAYATFTHPVALTTSLFATISSRTVDSADATRGMRARIETTTAGVVKILILAQSSAATISTTTVSGLVHTGQALRIRYRTAGITSMVKVWDPGATSEPASWQAIADDTTLVSPAPGTVVLTSTASASNTNVPFTALWDDVVITDIEPRFCGELTSLPVRWSKGAPSAGAVWVPVQAGSFLRRMSSVREQPKSAMWRYLERNQTGLQGYWPMTNGAPAGVAPIYYQFPILGELADGRTSGPGAAVFYGQPGLGVLAGWLEPGMQFAATPSATIVSLDRVNVPANSGAGWSIDWVRMGAQPATTAEHLNITLTGSGDVIIPWSVTLDQSAVDGLVTISDPNLASHTADIATTGLYDGTPHHLRFKVAKSGSNLTYNLYVDGTSLLSGTITPPDAVGASALATVGWDHLDTIPAAIGHIAVWDTNAPDVTAAAAAALGHPGEDVVARLTRVCTEEGLAYRIVDSVGDGGENLGEQPIGTPYDVMAAAAAADQGFLAELRDAPGPIYYTRASIYSQSTYTYSYTTDGHLQDVPEPTDDDAHTVNSATITKLFGSPQTYEQTTGPLSTAAPPDGVGRYDTSGSLNVLDQTRTLHAAEWRVSLGTVDKPRWPTLGLSVGHLLKHSQVTEATNTIKLDMGYRLTLTDLPSSFLPPADVDLLVLGSAETIDQFQWRVIPNCGPYDPYNTGVWSGTARTYKWDAVNSTLAAGVSSSATSLSVATSSGSLWTTAAGDFPFDINISGIRITVTNITGAVSPQTFTVTRSVDGFDLALAAGASVSLWTQTKWGL